MAQIQKGTTYSTGDQVTAANLNALADAAILLPGAITDQTAKTVPLAADTILLHSAADTALRKSTLTQLFSNATGIPLTTGVTGILPAANGGTGVNNGANTLTLAGNVTHAGAFTQSFTATANTALTLPVTGTLATLAGSEALSNKTITASAFNGTVGATTPSTVAATTIGATGTITSNPASGDNVNFQNGAGVSLGKVFNDVGFFNFQGSANVSGTRIEHPTQVQHRINGATVTTTTSTGLAVTGALSASSSISAGTGSPPTTGVINSVGTIGFATSDNANSSLYVRNGSGGTIIGTDAGGNLRLAANGSTSSQVVAVVSSSGVAVTGTLSATGTISTSAGNITALNGILQVGSGSKQLYIRTLSGINRIDSYDNPITAAQPILINASTMAFQIADSTKMTLDASGNVGIGTSSPATKLQVHATGIAYNTAGLFITTAGGTDGIAIGDSGSGAYKSIQSYGGALSLNSLGNNVGIGTTSPAQKLHVNSSSATVTPITTTSVTGDTLYQAILVTKFDNDSTTSQNFIQFQINNGGANCGKITANGANTAAFGSTSDRRVKENIADLPSQLASIMALRPVEFDYVESYGGGHQIGFVAQEMQQVYPDVIAEDSSEEKILSITGWSKTEARLVKALQELNANLVAELQSLRQRVAALESNQ